MNRIETILSGHRDISEVEANALAFEILLEIEKQEISIIVEALIHLSECRADGAAFSREVSIRIADWIYTIYESLGDDAKSRVIDLMFELKSQVAVTLINKLLPLTENEHLLNSLYAVAEFAGT